MLLLVTLPVCARAMRSGFAAVANCYGLKELRTPNPSPSIPSTNHFDSKSNQPAGGVQVLFCENLI